MNVLIDIFIYLGIAFACLALYEQFFIFRKDVDACVTRRNMFMRYSSLMMVAFFVVSPFIAGTHQSRWDWWLGDVAFVATLAFVWFVLRPKERFYTQPLVFFQLSLY